jgi:DNA polymerase delta subunit 1
MSKERSINHNSNFLDMKRGVKDPNKGSRESQSKRIKKSRPPFKVKYLPKSKTHIPRGKQGDGLDEYYDTEDLNFQIVDWHSEDVITDVFEEDEEDEWGGSREDPRQYMIRIFGVTENGHSVASTISGFNPFFYVKVPTSWSRTKCAEFVKENITHKKGTRRRFDPDTQEMYMVSDYKDRNYRFENKEDGTTTWCSFANSLLEWKIVKKHDMGAGFTGIPAARFKFLKLTFKTLGSMKSCYWNLRKQKRQLKIDIYEANLDPQLRFMHIKEILAAGWVTLPGGKYKFIRGKDNREITTQIETQIEWTDIEPLAREDVAPLRQASFDIECYSHEHDKFPVPEEAKNPVFQIGTIIQDYGNPNKYIKHIITLKKCNPIKDTIVICCKTERELLIQWMKLLKESDPDILYGYNIFGFDLNYLMVRAELLGCEEFTYLGRMRFTQSELETKNLSSAAYGDNRFKMVPMPGRLQIDLLQVMLRDVKKYRSYKLGNISQQILSSKLPTDPIYCKKGETRVYIRHPKHSYKKDTVIHLFNMFKCGGYDYEKKNWR